jgi:hypothetical protein
LYHCYGGKGVFVCKEWDDFQAFHDWAMSHGYSEKTTMHRKKKSGPFSPTNCEWAQTTARQLCDESPEQILKTGELTCRKCGKRKPLKDFYKSKNTKCGVVRTCRGCTRTRVMLQMLANPQKHQKVKDKNSEIGRRWYLANKETIKKKRQGRRNPPRPKMTEMTPEENERERLRRRRYVMTWRLKKRGLTHETRRQLLESLDYRCQICGKQKPRSKLAIDHDHQTGLVRGVLCLNCNSGIGMFGDTLESVRKAVEYLENHYNQVQQ